MSSVFKSPKVTYVEPTPVAVQTVDNNETLQELEKKRKKRMGAISQLLSSDRQNGGANGKKKLGE